MNNTAVLNTLSMTCSSFEIANIVNAVLYIGGTKEAGMKISKEGKSGTSRKANAKQFQSVR